MNNWFKQNWQHLLAVGIFVAMAFVYASPVLDGKTLGQTDVMQSKAMQKEINAYKKTDGTGPLWTNQMFGGMPSYQIWANYPNNLVTYVQDALVKLFPSPANLIFLYLLGGYILFAVMGISFWLRIAGAIGLAFTSYNFIIIDAGHVNKALAIAYFPILIAGVFLIFRNKQIWGLMTLSLGMALELRANHVQMTYYLFMALGLYFIQQGWFAIKTKTYIPYLKNLGLVAVAVLIGVAVNSTSILLNNEYVKETMRGGTELSLNDEDKKVSKGLDKNYAYQWSQGIGECITFLIPNAYGGGGRTELPKDAASVQLLTSKGVQANQAAGFMGQFTYWGPKPFTSGPTYFGAVIFFLFVLGLVIVRNPMKWWILSAVLFSIALSLGKHFDSFSNIFFDYFPLYNKFRAVESILVIAALLVPVLAVMAVEELVEATAESRKELLKKGSRALYITGGFIVLLWVMPSLFLDFQGNNDDRIRQQMMQMSNGDEGFANEAVAAIQSDREGLLKADALRSLAFVLLAAGVLYLLLNQKIKKEYAFMALLLLILVDMWTVDKRYLNNELFISKSKQKNFFQPRPVDQQIMTDTDPNYRVFDQTISTFESASTSYFHKTVGGYSAVKLRRIQDVITHQIATDTVNEQVLNMLNTKYYIFPDRNNNNEPVAVRNPGALGNAWFVKKISFAKDANEEMKALSKLQPKEELITDVKFESMIKPIAGAIDSSATIQQTAYHPEKLTYAYSSSTPQTVVFSEIYYKDGWNAYVDGKETPYFRANYILRAIQMPAGKHTIEFRFEPKMYAVGERIAMAGSLALILLIGGGIFMEWRNRKQAAA